MIRLEMSKKQEAILAAIILVAAFGVFILYSGIFQKPEPIQEPAPPAISEIVAQSIEHHDSIDDGFLGQLGTGVYTFDNPLIAVNPYGASPLTALIMFWSEQAAAITVTVNGKTPDVNVSSSYYIDSNYIIIPVYGLYPNMVNLVELTCDDQSSHLLIETGGIPDWFPANLPQIKQPELVPAVISFDPPIPGSEGDLVRNEQEVNYYEYEATPREPAEPPFYFTFVRKSAFDVYGDYRWCYTGFGTSYPTNYADNGNILMIVGSFDTGDAILLEVNLLGRIIAANPVYDEHDFTGYGIHHTVRQQLGHWGNS